LGYCCGAGIDPARLTTARSEQISRDGCFRPLSIQQIAIASRWPAESAWSESFKPSPATPPRGFSFAAIRQGETVLLVYSVHFKSNRGELQIDIAKREEAARQLITHTAEMERLYSTDAKVVTVIAGDFNTDPTDSRFAEEKTFGMLRQKFEWAWENVPLSERVTLPANGRYPDASFDGFLLRGAQVLSCKAIPIQEVSDHFPAILTIAIH
jgi:endonuclease/exonuclease/phosphatase family metal-dependent hydrolase